jgi:hypothetical protein
MQFSQLFAVQCKLSSNKKAFWICFTLLPGAACEKVWRNRETESRSTNSHEIAETRSCFELFSVNSWIAFLPQLFSTAFAE